MCQKQEPSALEIDAKIKKKVRFALANAPTQDRARRIKKI